VLQSALSVEQLSLLFFLTLLVLIFLGVPLAFTLGGTAILFALLFWGPASLHMFASNTLGAMQNIVIVAVPLFIFMGCLLEVSGIGEDLYEFAYRTLGRIGGGLAIGTVGICAIFAAMVGSSAPATVSMGLTALPSMLKRKYSREIAIGCIAGGGALGILIPPSIPMILYAMITGTSVGQLFIGGILPGLLITAMFMAYIGVRCALKPGLGPPIPKEVLRQEKTVTKATRRLGLTLIMPIGLIIAMFATIYAGVATPTEAASVGAFGALIVGVINGRLNRSVLNKASLDALGLTTMVMWLTLGGVWLGSVYQAIGASRLVSNFLMSFDIGRWGIMIIMQSTWFVLGMLMDPAAILFMTMPIYFPIVTDLGFDPIWFGVLFIVNMEMSYLTPPFGLNLFYLKAIAPIDITMRQIIRSCLPFIAIQAIALVLVMLFPQIILWLPSQMVK